MGSDKARVFIDNRAFADGVFRCCWELSLSKRASRLTLYRRVLVQYQFPGSPTQIQAD